jgi:hypothetical protein
MPTVDVTIIDRAISDGLKRQIASSLSDVLVTHDLARTSGNQRQWRVVAEAVRPTADPARRPDLRFANLDYAAWHAHLSGVCRWIPGGS